MSQHPARVFLGWDGPLLARAADWLIREYGEDCSEVIVALPGGRAGRILQEQLARLASPAWLPPRIVTQGELTDQLVNLDTAAAGRIVRTLVWEKALRAAPKKVLERLLQTLPSPEDAGAWSRLAETLRSLHGELAPEGREFSEVAEILASQGNAGESSRWKALASIQDSYRNQLSELSLSDPHEARLAAIESGNVHCAKRIVLVGVADMNHLLRRALDSVASEATTLVFAPEEEANGFDEWGCLRVEEWKDRNVPLGRENWLVADKPADQARILTEWLSEQGSQLRAENVTVGIADEEVAPFIERRLAQAEVRTRHAAGFPVERTLPFRLLESVTAYLQSRSWSDWSALIRHPDLDALLAEKDGASVCDAYHGRFLPNRIEGEVFGTRRRADEMRALCESLNESLGGLMDSKQHSLAEWSTRACGFLAAVYREREYDEQVEPERAAAACLREISSIHSAIAALPEALIKKSHGAAEALGFLLRELRASFIPPAPASDDEPTVELLGWLELPLDDADHLVVTGFSDGKVPEAMGSHAFLPNGLRSALKLVDADARQARDVHEVTVLCHSRKTAFVTGRRSASGEPLAPSRLAFHCEAEETPERVKQFIEVGAVQRVEESSSDSGPKLFLAGREGVKTPETISVTGFRDYLSSPYQFYLRHVLKLETLDDELRELDGAQFGNLAHDSLYAFGQSDARNALDARTIEAELDSNLRRLVREKYGKNPVPTIALQVEQLGYRFHVFAERQEAWARDGWKIEHVEWSPPGGAKDFNVDGDPIQVKGRIDRIDRNTRTGRWAILDYKTSDKAKSPSAEHYAARAKYWKDLQLPLYCLLTMSLEMGELPELGYANLGRDDASIEFSLIRGWDEDKIEEAEEVAREVVRNIRAGQFFDVGRGRAFDFITQSLCGVGVMETGSDEEELEL